MNLSIMFNPLSLTYDFMDEASFAAIPSGQCVCEGDLEVEYVAACYPDNPTWLDMLIVVREGVACPITIGTRCRVGVTDTLLPVDPAILPWKGGIWPNPVRPDEFQAYPSAQTALSFGLEILKLDPVIREYLLTGSIQCVESRSLTSARAIGFQSKEDAWPFNYAVYSLQVLALSGDDLRRYLPLSVPHTVYFNDSIVGQNPVYVFMSYIEQFLSVGTYWNAWIFTFELVDEWIEKEFVALRDLFYEMQSRSNFEATTIVISWEQLVVELEPCRLAARHILKRLGWDEPPTKPWYTWDQVMDVSFKS